MKTIRNLVQILALVVLFAALAACSEDSDTAPADQDHSGDQDAEVQEAEEEVPPQAFALTHAFPPVSPTGQALEFAFSAEGGQEPYGSWQVVLGELPPGTSLDASTGTLSGTPTEEGFYYFVLSATDAEGTSAEELFGIRIGDPATPGPMAERAKGYLEVYEDRHLWGGLSFNLTRPDDPSGDYGLTTCGDCSFQSGQCTAAMAFRHAVEGSEASLSTIREQIEGWSFFQELTQVKGLSGRCYGRLDWPWSEDWSRLWPDDPYTEDPKSIRYAGEGEYTDYVWRGDVSRDQMTGAVLGVSTAYDMVDNEDVKTLARNFLVDLADHLWDNDLMLIDRDGEVTSYGQIDGEWWEGWPTDNGLDAVSALAWFKAAYHASGEDRFADMFTELYENREYLRIMRDAMWVYMGYATKWYNTYMAFENFFILQRLEEDPQRFEDLKAVFRDTLWLNLDDDTPNRRGIKEHNPVKTSWYLYSTGERDARSLYHALYMIDVFPDPPLRDRKVENSKNPDIEINPDQPDEALYPLPSYARKPDMVIWHRSPFELDGGVDSGEERTGCDYLLPYWMGRYYGFIGPDW